MDFHQPWADARERSAPRPVQGRGVISERTSAPKRRSSSCPTLDSQTNTNRGIRHPEKRPVVEGVKLAAARQCFRRRIRTLTSAAKHAANAWSLVYICHGILLRSEQPLSTLNL